MRACLLLIATFSFLAVWERSGASESGDIPVAVIVGTEFRTELTREDLRAIFLQKRRFWESGIKIQAVNLPPANRARRVFSTRVLGATPEELDDYWKEMYFHGERPPYVFASEEAVLRFVAQTPGAIGYVHACTADKRVHIVWQSDPASCPR